jgi:EAL and modified HD-GYP domain-containing signal transduction protein
MLLVPERIVLELSANVTPTDHFIDRCVFLKRAGFKILLEHYRPGVSSEKLLAVADYLKLDMRDSRPDTFEPQRLQSLSGQVKLVGGYVESEQAYVQAKRLGCDYFQGFYFAKPALARGKQISSQKMALFELLRLILSDASNREIEQRLKLEPALCYNLLRLVNSAGSGLARRIDNLQEVILVLGRQNLSRWLQLLLYTHEDQFSHFPNPLMQSAAFRGRFLEYMAVLLPGGQSWKDKAFMVGILSHVEALLQIPMSQVLLQIHLSEDVEQALLSRKGVLGQLLELAEAMDAGDFERAGEISRRLSANQGDIHRGVVEALRWSNALGRAA